MISFSSWGSRVLDFTAKGRVTRNPFSSSISFWLTEICQSINIKKKNQHGAKPYIRMTIIHFTQMIVPLTIERIPYSFSIIYIPTGRNRSDDFAVLAARLARRASSQLAGARGGAASPASADEKPA